MKSLSTYKQRAEAAKEAKETYTVDQGKMCICHCGQVHWKRKEEKNEEKKESHV
jgi:hypothetical protein